MSHFKAPDRFVRKDFDWEEGIMIRKGCAVKYKRFADAYLECGNATEAAEKAGYSAKSARQKGTALLRNEKVKEYICLAQKEMDSASIASASEVLQYLTAVMRGEIKDQFDLEPSLADRTRAAVELAKRLCDVEQQRPSVVIVNNLPTSDMMYMQAQQTGEKRKRGRPRKNFTIDVYDEELTPVDEDSTEDEFEEDGDEE